jgi:hypothetical protein
LIKMANKIPIPSGNPNQSEKIKHIPIIRLRYKWPAAPQMMRHMKPLQLQIVGFWAESGDLEHMLQAFSQL